jgi:hypothetical protein
MHSACMLQPAVVPTISFMVELREGLGGDVQPAVVPAISLMVELREGLGGDVHLPDK